MGELMRVQEPERTQLIRDINNNYIPELRRTSEGGPPEEGAKTN